MYKYAYKHIELFQKIPFKQFVANSGFINKVITESEKYASYENIIKCYYFISEELWDPLNTKPIITNETDKFCFYDFIRKRQSFLKKAHYKHMNLFNGVFDKDGQNRHFKRYYGLIAQPKSKNLKSEAYKLRDMFITYAHIYNNDLKFYKRNEYELPTEWAEHLYEILNKLSANAIFFYKQRGSIILATEMINILSSYFLFVASKNRIKISKENRQKVMRQIEENKRFMFLGLKHDWNHYYENKARLEALSKAKQQIR